MKLIIAENNETDALEKKRRWAGPVKGVCECSGQMLQLKSLLMTKSEKYYYSWYFSLLQLTSLFLLLLPPAECIGSSEYSTPDAFYSNPNEELQEYHPNSQRLLCAAECNGCILGVCSFGCVNNQYLYLLFPARCDSCSVHLSNCLTCQIVILDKQCTACQSTAYYLSSGDCYSCSSALVGCATCSSATTCTSCQSPSTSYIGSGGCYSCSAAIVGCASCTSATTCTTCQSPSTTYLSGGACHNCSDTLVGCISCTSATVCTVCQFPSSTYVDSTGCHDCNATLVGCIACSSATVCTTCQSPTTTYVDSTGCHSCSDAIVGCASCTSFTACTACLSPSTTYINSGACYNCSDAMAGCVSCTSATFCLSIANNSYYMGLDNKPHPCSDYSPNCGTCTAAPGLTSFTCDSCLSTAVLNVSSCVSCDAVMPSCSSCTSVSYCSACFIGHYVYTNHTGCGSCENLTYCYLCTSEFVCATCIDTGVYLETDQKCYLCNQTLNYCLNCSVNAGAGEYNCTKCQNTHYVSSNICVLCSTSLTSCLLCSSSTICLECVDNFTCLASNSKCQPCQNHLPGCGLCSSCAMCLGCINNSYAFTGGVCLPCPFGMAGCLTCNSTTECLSCSSTYFLDSDNKCYRCRDYSDHCLTCSKNGTDILCYSCNSTSYFLNGTHCQVCSSAISFCDVCTNDSYCFSCFNNSYLFLDGFTNCQPCDYVYDGCDQCNDTHCLMCFQDLELIDNKCQCAIGWEVKGLCTKIVGCIQPENYPNGEKGCSDCETTQFFPTPVNEACQCLEGVLAGKSCINVMGCVSALTDVDGIPHCVFCNITANFVGMPTNGECLCLPHTELSGNECVDVCGDGFTPLNSYQCDDGNQIDGDGCSAECAIEPNYRCEGGSPTSASVCTYKGFPMQLSLTSITKKGLDDQGVFKFSLYPALLTLSKMDFSEYGTLTCEAEKYSINDVSYEGGVLTYSVDYWEDLEEKDCQLSLSFDQSVVVSQNVTLAFRAISQTRPLIITKNPKLISSQVFIFKILSYICLAFLVFSIGHKMISVEVILPFQLAYLSNIFYQKVSFFSLVTEQSGYIAGGSPLFSPTINQNFSFIVNRIAISFNFLENTAPIVGFFALILIAGVAIVIWGKISSKKGGEEQGIRKIPAKHEKALSWLYRGFAFQLSMSFFIPIVISSMLNSLREKQEEAAFSGMWTSLSLLFVICFMTVLTLQVFLLKSQQPLLRLMLGLEGASKWYIAVYLTKLFAFSMLIQAGFLLNNVKLLTYAAAALLFLFFVIFLLWRPYERVFFQLALLTSELTGLYATALPLVRQLIEVDEQLEILLIFALQGLIALNIGLGVIRLIIVYWTKCKHGDKPSEKAEGETRKLKAECRSKLIPRSPKNKESEEILTLNSPAKGKRSGIITQAKEVQIEMSVSKKEEDQKLKELKERLRADLFKKKLRKNTRNKLEERDL